MHRRQLLRSLAGGVLIPAATMTVRAQSGEDATPMAMPPHHGLPRPVVLGDDIELIDYRIYPSTDVPRIIGEIVNTGDEMVDSPVVSVIFPELGDAGLAYAPPFLPVMRTGESNMIFGVLPDGTDTGEELAAARFGLCGPVRPAEYSERLDGADLRVSVDLEGYWEGSLNVAGTIHNAGTEPVLSAAVNGLVRDHNGRYVGVTVESGIGELPGGATKEFFLWASSVDSSLADPYLILGGSTEYSVSAVPGISKPFTLPGCPAIFASSD